MNPSELADWAWSKACNTMRKSGTCNDAACRKIEQAVGLLRRIERFEGTDGNGDPVTGYIIKD